MSAIATLKDVAENNKDLYTRYGAFIGLRSNTDVDGIAKFIEDIRKREMERIQNGAK
jgi:hypothetical protein